MAEDNEGLTEDQVEELITELEAGAAGNDDDDSGDDDGDLDLI